MTNKKPKFKRGQVVAANIGYRSIVWVQIQRILPGDEYCAIYYKVAGSIDKCDEIFSEGALRPLTKKEKGD